MSTLFSNAFEELAPGERFTTRGRTVTEADVVGFAALTGDWHPQHADAEWADELRLRRADRARHARPVVRASGSCRSTPSA